MDKYGEEKDSTSLHVFYSPVATEIGGHITTDTILVSTESPFLITESVIVDPGATLSISPGCVIIFSIGTGLEIQGKLVAQGSEDETIHFTSLDRLGSWNGIKFINSHQDNILQHCAIANASYWSFSHVGAIECINSNLSMADCVITDAKLVGIDVLDSDVSIDRCHFKHIHSGYDGDIVQIRGKSSMLIERSLLEDTNADAVDVSQGNLTIRETIIRDCVDKALSLSGGGTTIIDKAIITDCAIGIGVKDNITSLTNTIIAECKSGIRFYYPDNASPPQVRMRNSVIWRAGKTLDNLESPDSIETQFSYIQNYPSLSIPGDYDPERQFINTSERNFRLYLYSPFMTVGENGGPLIDTQWMNDITW
jgi:hypothetical protein